MRCVEETHVEKMENNRIAKRVYVGKCAGSYSVGRPQERWINTVKECLKKRGWDVKEPRRIVCDRSVWQGFVRGNAWGIAWWMMMVDLDETSQLYEVLEGWRAICGQAHNLSE